MDGVALGRPWVGGVSGVMTLLHPKLARRGTEVGSDANDACDFPECRIGSQRHPTRHLRSSSPTAFGHPRSSDIVGSRECDI